MRVCLSAFLVAGLIAPLLHAEGDAAVKTKDAVPTFVFDLRNLSGEGVLPFDQRFNVRAKVNTAVKSGAVRFYDLTRMVTDGNTKKERKPCPCGASRIVSTKPPGECNVFEEDAPKITGALVAADTPDPMLVFPVGTLQPNHDYCFVFDLTERVESAQMTEVRRRARTVLEADIKPVPLNDDERKALRLRIGNEIRDIVKSANKNADIAKDSLFGSNPDGDERQQEAFNRLLRALSQKESNRKTGVEAFCRRRESTLKNLRKLLEPGTPSRQLLDLIRTASESSDEKVAEKIAAMLGDDGAAALKAIVVEGRAEQVLGDDVCSSLPRAVRPRQVDGPLDNLTNLSKEFELLMRKVTAIVRNDAAAKALGLTAREKENAEKSIKSFESAQVAIDDTTHDLTRFQVALTDRETAFADALLFIEETTATTVGVQSTSTDKFTTRHNYYVSMDVGVASAFNIDEAFSYAAANFYTRPINKEVPLRRGEDAWIRKRLSFSLGFTLQEVKKDNVYGGVLGARGIVTAVGWRVLDSVKFSAGALVLRENDTDPLVDKTHLAATPFIAISLDWDVRESFKSLGSVFGVP